MSELAAQYGMRPAMIHQWKKTLLEGAADIFERGGRRPADIDEGTVRDLHAKIGELAVANDFCRESLSYVDIGLPCDGGPSGERIGERQVIAHRA